MAFAEEQTKALSAKLNGKHVKSRELDGIELSYIEGWHCLAEANRIFGFDGWDRETLSVKCVWDGTWSGRKGCAYTALVRIRVRAGDTVVCRDGSGAGHGWAQTLGEAHESALKEAETDATKRALTTFGNAFGLALYDKAQSGVRQVRARRTDGSSAERWVVMSSAGRAINEYTDPVQFFSAVKHALETIKDLRQATAFWERNEAAVERIQAALPDLKTEAGHHYSDVLTGLYQRRIDELRGKPGPNGQSVDKSILALGEPRRLRDPEHLRRVASLPCLICERSPSQAHHLRFAQPRATSRKVSDEWVVPLCTIHHRALHEAGDERRWWGHQAVDPILEASKLWAERRDGEERTQGAA